MTRTLRINRDRLWALATTADGQGLSGMSAMSGAGHDAREVSAICRTGTDVLASSALRLAHQP